MKRNVGFKYNKCILDLKSMSNSNDIRNVSLTLCYRGEINYPWRNIY